MGHPVAANRIAKGGRHMALAGDFVEALGAPFSCDDLIAQNAYRPAGGERLRRRFRRSGIMPRIDRRAYPIAAKFLLRLLPSGSDRIHRIPNSKGTLRSTLDMKRDRI